MATGELVETILVKLRVYFKEKLYKTVKNSKYPIWKKALGLVALLFFTVSLSAQTTYYSRQDGDWDVAATWSTIACGDAIAAGTPGAGDDIVICAGDTVTMVVNTTLRHLTINSNGTLNQDGNRSTITGNYVNNGTHDGGDDRVQLTGVGTTLDGTGIVINPNPFRLEVGDKTILATANLTINNSAGNNRGHVRDNITVTNNGSITYTRDIQSFGGSETWINAANSTLRIGEDFFPNGGTLDATAPGNTVEYNGGAGAQTLYDPSGFTYWHLTIYGGGTKTPDGGGNLDINGNLTISSAFDIDAAGIDITVAGNWSNTGTFIEGTRKVTLDGSGSQSLSATGGETFYDLEIVKGTGTLTCNDNVTVSTTAGGTLTMTSGNIDMKTNVLTLGTAATNLGTLTRVSGTIIGKFERWINTTVSPGPPVLYPVGTASDYRPANVTFNSLPTNGSLIGEFVDSDPRDYGNPWSDGPETARNTFSEGYWILTVNNGLTSADYNVELTGTNFTSFSPFVAETRVLVRQNETFDWGIDGNQVAADVSTKTGKRNNITTLTAHLCLADTTNCSPPVTSAIVGVDSVCTNATGENYSVNSQDGSSYSWIVAGGTIASSGIKQSYTPTSDFNTFISFPPLQDLSLINDGDLDTGTIWGPATPDPYELTMTFPASVAIDSVRVRGGQADGDLNKPTEMKLYRGTSAGTLLLTINPVSYTMTGYGFSNDTTSTVYTWVFTPAASNSGIREIECYSSNGITVDWNAIGGTGTLQVTETNACGVGALATKNINKHPLPTSAITGSSSVAENSTGEAYSVINNPGYTYTWTITGGTQATGGTSNSITVNWGTSGTGEVKVVANAVGCGSAAADSITITITDVVISVQDGDWDVPSTWDCNCNPPDGANAIISTGDTVTLTVNETINNLTLSANSRLNNDGNRMTITGNYKNDGVHDGGSDRVALTGTATTIDGTGTVFNANAFRLEIGNKTILSTANLTISTNGNIVEIRNGITVVNNGTFIVSGGDLRDNNAGTVWTNATNSTLKVTHRCLDFNAAVLNASASGNLVEYNGTANQDIKQPSGNTYWHLTLGGGGTKSLQNANHDINGNIIISSIFDINGLDISLAGNWTNTGTFTEGTRKVTLDGATDQTIINGSTEQFYELTINKSAGKVILNDNVIVANTLDLVSRNIDAKTNNKKLTLGTGTGNIGTLSRTSGHIIGQFERWVDATGTWYYWPVGTTGDYRPDSVRLNTASTFGSLISEFVETDPQDYGNPWIDAGDTVFRTFSEGYWAVTKANSLTTSDFDLRLTGTGFTSYNFAPGTRLLTRINETFDWGIDGTHVTASASTTRRSNVATLSGHFCWGDTTHCTNPVTSVITGSDSVCINDAAVPYSVVDGNGNTFTWTITGGLKASGGTSGSITIDWGSTGMVGNVQVVEQNALGCSGDPVNRAVNIHTLPTSAITGSALVEENTTGAAYSVTNNTGYTYTWTITGGTQATGGTTNSITVNWGAAGAGKVSVSASTGCSTAATVDLDVTVYGNIISVKTGNWNDPTTWDCNCNPADNDNAIIDTGDTVYVTLDETINHLTIRATARLEHNAGRQITVNGNYTSNSIHDAGGDRIFLYGAGANMDGTAIVNNVSQFGIRYGTTILSTANFTVNITAGGDARVYNNVTNNGIIEFNGDVNNGGSGVWINATNSIVKFGGTVAPAITASATGNTVEYDEAGNQNIVTPSSGIYYHLIASGGGIKSLLGNLDINGDLTISSTLNSNGRDLNLAGHWSNTGAFTEGTRTVTIDGSADQTITNASVERFFNLTINKAAGKWILNDNVEVEGTFTLTSGNVDAKTNSKKLTVGISTAATGALTYTSGHVIGQLERWVASTGTWFLWPVGTNLDYRPNSVQLNTVTTFGSLISEFIDTDPQDYGNPWLDGADSVFRTFSEGYWDLTRANSLLVTSYDLDLTGNGFTSAIISGGTRIMTRPDALTDWGLSGTHATATGNTTRRTGVATLSAHHCFGDTTHCTTPVTSGITGVDSVCINQSAVSYFVTNTGGSTYTWTIVGGLKATGGTTSSITVDWGATGMVGSVQVVEKNTLGCSGDPVIKTVNIHTMPTSAITGSISEAENTTGVPYSVIDRAGYTYTWTITGGTQVTGGTTNSITVNWGSAGAGKVSVSASTGCSTAATVDLDVTLFGTIISVQTGNWDVPSTWDCNCNPADIDNAIIDAGHTVTVTVDEIINNLTVRATATLQHNAVRQITITGNYTNKGIHNAGADRILLDGAGNIDGTGTVTNVDQFRMMNGNKIVLSTANLTINPIAGGEVRIEDNITVTNNGFITFGGNVWDFNGGENWVNAANSVVYIGGAFFENNGGGTLNASSTGNKVRYNGAANQNIKVPLTSYYDLFIEGGATKSTAGNIVISNDLTISSTLDVTAGNDQLNLGGNWVNTGTFVERSGTVIVDGIGAQAITNSSGEMFFGFTTNKASGTLTIHDDVTVSNTLTMTSGNIITGTDTMILGTGTGNVGGVTRTGGTVVGYFKRWFNTVGDPAPPVLFPVGTVANYRPAEITFNTLPIGGMVVADFVASSPGKDGLPAGEAPLSPPDSVRNTFTEGYWHIDAVNALSSIDYDLRLTGNGFTSYGVNASTRVLKRPTGTTNWTLDGNHAGDVTLTAFRNNVNDISEFDFCFGDSSNCTQPVTSAITGNNSVCINESGVSYSVTNTSGSTYKWTITGGLKATGGTSSSITVDWGGTGGIGSVQVVETNSTGCVGDPITKAITIHPVSTSVITGTTNLAENTLGEPYSVVNNTGYSYAWTITGGTQAGGGSSNSITVDWGAAGVGNVQVVATITGCTSAAAEDLAVTKYGIIKSITTGNWDVPGTWDCTCIPADDNSVIIDIGHVVTLTANEIISNITIYATGELNNATFLMTVNGDYKLSGIHSGTGDIHLDGASKNISGNTGTISNTGILRIDGNKTVLTGTSITKTSGETNINGSYTVFNNGTITLGGDLVGANATSTWRNEVNSTLSVGGAVIVTGVLNASANNNTVDYNGTGAQTIKVPSVNYHNLVVSNNGTKTLGGNVDINGDLTLRNTALLDAAANTITLAGNWDNETVSDLFDETGSTVIFDGGAAQNINFDNIFDEVFNNFTINNSSGDVTLANGSNATVNGIFTLTSGDVITGGNFMILGASATVTGGSATSFVSGKMRHTVNVSTLVTKVFPIGIGTNYRPIELEIDQSVTTTTEYTAEMIPGDANALGYTLPGTIDLVSLVRSFQVTQAPATALDDTKIRIYYESDDGVTDAPNLAVAKDDGAGNWIDLSGTGLGSPSGNIISGSFTTFSRFALSNKNAGVNPLPIELLYFDAQLDEPNEEVDLIWLTATETNNDYFTVERSADGLDFEFLTYLDGAGNSNSRKEYSFVDTDPLYGTSYYRLKQTDYDGNAETFPMVAVVYELEEKMSIVVYPNPTHGKFWVDVEGAEGEEVLVVVLDMWGREHYSKIIILEDTGYTLAFDPYGKLSAGVYLIVGSSNNRLYSKKLIIR